MTEQYPVGSRWLHEAMPFVAVGKRWGSRELQMQDAPVAMRSFDGGSAGVADQRTHNQHITSCRVDGKRVIQASSNAVAANMRSGDYAKWPILIGYVIQVEAQRQHLS